MKRINVLDFKTSQLIAAGEVTENPASVVKELLENSIDAGSTRIVVEIKSGGTKLIKVCDNGHGIYREDVKDAFSRHATSKLKNSEDINKISSLGFRGEALASISSVSRVELITKSHGETLGTSFFVEGGIFGEITDIGCSVGSTIIVRDLFYNTPARMKFLKKDVVEGNKVASIVDRIALSHPEILFKFIRDGKETLCTVGDGKISSDIYSVYGKSFFEGMIPLKYSSGSIVLEGYVSTPEKCRPSKNMQIFFVNGRFVKEQLVSAALEEAFKNSLMSGKNPYCVIYLNIPCELVDVNVHPSKREIRFANEKEIFEIIYSAVKKALSDFNLKTSIIPPEDFTKQKLSNPLEDFQSWPQDFKIKPIFKEDEDIFQNCTFNDFTASKGSFPINLNSTLLEMYKPLGLDTNLTLKPQEGRNFISNSPAQLSCEEKRSIKDEPRFSGSIKVIGEVFGCYFVVQCGETLIMIDKHAAHERIIFEKMKKEAQKLASQVLLRPIPITLEKEEYSAVIDNLELFSKAGYEIEEFGPGNVIVRSAPMYEDFDKLEAAVIETANYILDNKMHSETKKLEWIYHSISCRSAIKAGNKTSPKEIYALIKDVLRSPNLKYCPHGRPIYIEFSKKLIEKRFGRT